MYVYHGMHMPMYKYVYKINECMHAILIKKQNNNNKKPGLVVNSNTGEAG